MKALILCGGMGTRLREQTETRPKPMVEVGGIPILVHIMRMYARHGVKDFILCVGYKGQVIKEYFLALEAMFSDFTIEYGQRRSVTYHGLSDKELEGWRVTVVDTGENSGTGERIRRAARHLAPETFFVTYGDGLANVNPRAVLDYHRTHGKLATITGVRPPSRFGEIDQQHGRVLAFNEKPQASQGLINGGFMCLEPGFLRYLERHPGSMLEKEPMEDCVADGELMVHEHSGFWQCMDTYRDWEHLEALWRSGNAPWM